jgi:hypothetical protein
VAGIKKPHSQLIGTRPAVLDQARAFDLALSHLKTLFGTVMLFDFQDLD